MIRSLIPIMGTWGFIAYAYFKQPWLIQPVNIFGIFGLSLINTLFGYALGQYTLAWFDKRWQLDPDIRPVDHRKARNWLVGTSLAFLGWIILSLIMLGKPTENKIRVAAIQPDYKSLWTEAEEERNYLTPERFQQVSDQTYERLISQTKEAAKLGARIIVWPEGGLAFDPQQKNTLELKKLAADTNAYLVLAYGVEDRNEVTILSPDGKFLGTYGKNHPVTFVGEKSTTQGTYPTYTTDLGELGTIICYDMDFTDTARNVARNGADLVAVPSGDWPGIAEKHYAHLVFRAAENRTAMIKVDRSYDSVVIDPYGRIVDQIVSKNGKRATLVADVTTIHTNTIQQFLGDWIGWVCLGGLLVFSFLNLSSKNRKNQMRTSA
jgi:apolipoprotein N-acyltransferase